MKRIFQEGGDQLVSRNEVADVFFAPNDKVQQELSSSLRELFELGNFNLCNAITYFLL